MTQVQETVDVIPTLPFDKLTALCEVEGLAVQERSRRERGIGSLDVSLSPCGRGLGR